MQLNIDFIKEYSKTNDMWCSKYRYDFYFKLNNEKYIVETKENKSHLGTNKEYVLLIKNNNHKHQV